MDNLLKAKEAKNILIRNGLLVDTFSGRESHSDIFIENGLISTINKKIDIPESKEIKLSDTNRRLRYSDDLLLIDATGYLISPGFFDMHVHLRDPGDGDEETLESGIKAALKGGITTLACMPNTSPVLDNEYLLKYILLNSDKLDFKILPVAAMTIGLEGKEIVDLGSLSEAGAAAFSDDGKCIQDARLMYEIMRYSSQYDKLLILHEEDYSFSRNGQMHEGLYSSKLGLEGISSLTEETIIARDLLIAKKTGARIHITHLSSKGSVEIIKKAKEDGIKITCDVTPHHICFDDSFLEGYNTDFKVNPPLRSAEDREALVSGLKNGIIDAIASDHAPHLKAEKNTTFARAANGVTGMETLFSSVFDRLCERENFDSLKMLRFITEAPL